MSQLPYVPPPPAATPDSAPGPTLRLVPPPAETGPPPASDAIPLSRAAVIGDETRYMAEAAASAHLAGDGPFTRRCRLLLEACLAHRVEDVERQPSVLLTTSCTHALELAALILGIEPGDEVIVPSFTFVSTANAFALRGARIRFADIRPDTLNLDESTLPGLISARTRVIVPVHYAGVACEMDVILAEAHAAGRRYGRVVHVVEDNAHGLFGRFRGQPLGTLGSMGTQSFHDTKNFTCGEGGALVINDPELFTPGEIVREKGTDRSRFLRGEVDRYTWRRVGSSYLLSDLLSAFLFAQLEAREAVQAGRRRIWEIYQSELAGWANARGVQRPVVPSACEPAWHLYYLVMPDEASRDGLIDHLAGQEIRSAFHYVPLHLSEKGRELGGVPGLCPNTERIAACMLRLPLYHGMSEADAARVVEAVTAFEP